MIDDDNIPTRAEHLANLIKKQGDTTSVMATVQRSHRFPMHIISRIENMAKMADVPISLIINELLEVGLEAVSQNLTEDEQRHISLMSKEQYERPTKTVRIDTKKAKGKN